MKNRRHTRFAYLLALSLLLFVSLAGNRFATFDKIDKMYRVFAARIGVCLTKGLVSENHLPHGINGHRPDISLVAYVLGGMQESLSYKWKTVGRLYAEGTVRKILLLHRPGITEYSSVLGRNLTNDEWAIEKLREEGVAVETMEFVSVPSATFETFAEARAIMDLARSRRVKRLVLVTSMHHTERVRLALSYFNGDKAIEFYIYGSEEKAGIIELLRENFTLRFYRYFVLPFNRATAPRGSTSPGAALGNSATKPVR